MRRVSFVKVGVVALAAIIAAVFQACSSPCLQVQQVLCQCQGATQSERNTCEDNAKQQESLQPPSDSTQDTCDKLLPGCEAIIDGGSGCPSLQTDEGRKACGLSPK